VEGGAVGGAEAFVVSAGAEAVLGAEGLGAVVGAGAVVVEGGAVEGVEALEGAAGAGAATAGAAGGGAGQERDNGIDLSTMLFQDSYLYVKGYSFLTWWREWSMSWPR
jgi:hypothetical protein